MGLTSHFEVSGKYIRSCTCGLLGMSAVVGPVVKSKPSGAEFFLGALLVLLVLVMIFLRLGASTPAVHLATYMSRYLHLHISTSHCGSGKAIRSFLVSANFSSSIISKS